jgi:hypothetical protein
MTVSLHSDSSTTTTTTFQQANGYYPAKPTTASDASPTTTTPDAQSALYDVCDALKDKLEAFLAEEPETELLRNVQARLRVSMELTEESLRKYRYEAHLPRHCNHGSRPG